MHYIILCMISWFLTRMSVHGKWWHAVRGRSFPHRNVIRNCFQKSKSPEVRVPTLFTFQTKTNCNEFMNKYLKMLWLNYDSWTRHGSKNSNIWIGAFAHNIDYIRYEVNRNCVLRTVCSITEYDDNVLKTWRIRKIIHFRLIWTLEMYH